MIAQGHWIPSGPGGEIGRCDAGTRAAVLGGFLSILLGLAGCAGSSAPPPVGAAPSRETLHYVIERGDELEIRAFKIPELDDRVVVRADGKISVALLDDVEASGRTPEDLSQELTQRYAASFSNPQITVAVRNFATANVYVGGEVDRPGLIPLRYRMTSLKAIFHAGGFLETAQMTHVVVLRDVGGHPKMFELDAKDVLSGEARDLVLQPFDVVFVPRSKIARANLFVEQYIKRVIPIDLHGAVRYAFVTGAN